MIACMYIGYLHSFPGVSANYGPREKKIIINGGAAGLYLLLSANSLFPPDIELRTPAHCKLLVTRQYLVQFSVGDTPRSTKQANEKKNRTSWDEILYLWVMCIT